jgi:hypothetical protein
VIEKSFLGAVYEVHPSICIVFVPTFI